MFWVEGLPLEVGTNEVRLIATSAAGKLSSTNLSVVKSEVLLTIDSTPEGESLYEPFGVVSGTVSTPSYAVTVDEGVGSEWRLVKALKFAGSTVPAAVAMRSFNKFPAWTIEQGKGFGAAF
ncbi:MAG: hypothetical protein IT579_12660, partial [Verrucomicrobia subdivision 3 bacterium]|nr:hypothetical protein [Limisphaerales bacterium]